MVAAVDGELSLGMVGHALWRKKRAIIGPMLIMAATAFLGVNLITPRYKSEARVLIEGRENIFLRPEAEKATMDRSSVDPETVTSQVQLVLSRDLAREVIAELKLGDTPEFNAALRNSSPLTILRMIGVLKDPMSMSLEERVLSAYYERLSAYPVDKSRVIVIEFQSASPELAARIANTIAEKYLTFQQMAKQDQARSAGKWLSGELDKLRNKVSEAEAKVEEFRAKSNLFIGSNNTSLSNQQLTELNSQVSAARAQKADAEARSRLIRDALKAGQSMESLDVGNSELIRRLSEQRVTLRAQLAEQSSTLLPQHPRIKEMKAQVSDLDQQIRFEGERLARQLENEARVAGARLETLSASLDGLKKQAASTSTEDVQLRALEREAKAQRDLFESYLAKYREASARDSIAAAPADARIISRAVVTNVPYFPKKIPIVLIASLGTFALATAFVVTNALLSPDSYRSMPGTPEPAPLTPTAPPRSPSARTRSSDRVGPTPVLAATASVSRVQTVASRAAHGLNDIASAMREAGRGAVAVIGSGRNVGTTLTAIALARLLARNSRTVLVDLALSAPNVDVISNEPNAPGLANLVGGTTSFGDIITKDRFSRLHLVAVGQFNGKAADLFGSPLLAAAIGALAQSYDYLVIDAGAQSETPLAIIVAMAPYAILVGGDAVEQSLDTVATEMKSAGFADVAILTGAPPPLDHAVLQPSAA